MLFEPLYCIRIDNNLRSVLLNIRHDLNRYVVVVVEVDLVDYKKTLNL
jgi:hypothetical protein